MDLGTEESASIELVVDESSYSDWRRLVGVVEELDMMLMVVRQSRSILLLP